MFSRHALQTPLVSLISLTNMQSVILAFDFHDSHDCLVIFFFLWHGANDFVVLATVSLTLIPTFDIDI